MQAMSTSVNLLGADEVMADDEDLDVAFLCMHVQCAWNLLR